MLQDAAANGQEKVVRLLENGANVNLDGYYSTPLIWATSCGNDIARVWLMDCGANGLMELPYTLRLCQSFYDARWLHSA
jgi:hypothetical protein